MKRKTPHRVQTTADLVRSTRSQFALAAILRTGGGSHSDKRRAPEKRTAWRKEVWT
jgi:hypothetical protein